MNITVIGCGRLGLPYAVGLAEIGHNVLGVDANTNMIHDLNAGVTFDEPGLTDAVRHLAAAGRLTFTDSYADAAAFADLHFVAVGTPQQDQHTAADLSDVVEAFTRLARQLTQNSVVIGKSSVPVGTTRLADDTMQANIRDGLTVEVGWSPDFLRESTSLADTRRPARIILGVPHPASRVEDAARAAWKPLTDAGVPLLVGNWATAELAKGAANAFLATKTSFINVMAEVCSASGADVAVLATSLALDPRIGPSGLTPGLGYGGSCLAKDIRAFVARAEELGLADTVRMLREVDTVNTGRRTRHVQLAADILGELEGARIAVWGVAFKPNVDDIRDSPALDIAAQLHAEGAQVTLYDPAATTLAQREQPQLPHAPTKDDALRDADLLMVLTDWDEFRQADPARLAALPKSRRVIDGRTFLDPDQWRSAGWQFFCVGRP